jgi:glycosyltransferase involved in cell wall biosynthesis
LLQNLKPFNGRIKSSIFYEELIRLYLSEELRILIASGATGGTSKGSIGKYFHLKDFGEALTRFDIDYQLVRETDYVVGFPTKQIGKLISSKRKFKKLIESFKPDAVLVDKQSNFGLEVIKAGIPLFVILRGHHWSELEFAKETIYKDLLMRKIVDLRGQIAEKVFAGATAILPVADYLTNIIKEHHPQQSVEVYVEGVNSTRWYKQKGMQLKHPCVGLLQDANWWRKTREMLTLEKVIEKMPEVNFYWVGDGQYKDKILPVLEKFENFHWLGPLQYPDKVREYLTEIDVYALITGMDLASLSLKEAQLMGKPVVATNVGGNPEMMMDGKTGFLVKEGDVDDLFEKLSSLLKNKEMRLEKGSNGTKFIEEKFSMDASAKNFIRILDTYVKN